MLSPAVVMNKPLSLFSRIHIFTIEGMQGLIDFGTDTVACKQLVAIILEADHQVGL